MIHIAMADDEGLFRKGMRELLDDGQRFRFVLEAADGYQLLQLLEQATPPPDVLLLDISMPGMNGIETFDQVRQRFPDLKILMLSIHYSDHFIVALVEKGANGYLSKNAEPEEVALAIQTVAGQDFYFNEDTIRAMRSRIAGKPRKGILPGSQLSEREKEVLELICRELTAAEIAEQLYISKRTAEGHRNSLLLKTGCRNTAGLVIYAIRNQLFRISH
ncbi:MAG: response regulator transcription factor [Candidatus Pseudobacter hemicellulosilyticus]|uniref:Response regulator transcription factor n=1 Tax=Candidatus Pseudobacter hemicellulosilyticus TaxID=3121375 RepID=A0AAJ5WP59_9BACT|nr:MAG: response regulator transcription factor [Pseudobacter sp.]